MEQNGKDYNGIDEQAVGLDLYAIYEHAREYLIIIRARWLLVMFCGGVLGILMAWNSANKPTIHVATAIFHPDTENPKGGLDLTDPASLLSYSLSGYVPANNQIIGVLTSRRIADAVSQDTVIYKGKKRVLSKVYMELLNQSFSITRLVKRIFKGGKGKLPVYKEISYCSKALRKNLKILTDDNGFVVMNFSFRDPELARQISYLFVDELKGYFKQLKTEKATNNLIFFQKRSDSVRLELEKLQFDIGNFYNTNKYSTNLIDQFNIKQLEAQRNFLNNIYSDIALQLERTRAQLQRETPIIQVLDFPEPPFEKVKPAIVLHFLLGVFLGVLFISAYLLRNKIRRDFKAIIEYYMDPDDGDMPSRHHRSSFS